MMRIELRDQRDRSDPLVLDFSLQIFGCTFFVRIFLCSAGCDRVVRCDRCRTGWERASRSVCERLCRMRSI